MTLYYLLNTVRLSSGIRYPGDPIDSAVDDIAGIAAGGGVLGLQSDPNIAAAAVVAQKLRKQGVDPALLSTFMVGIGGGGGGGGAVASVFGRTGAVTAQPGDYTAAQVGAPSTSAFATHAAQHALTSTDPVETQVLRVAACSIAAPPAYTFTSGGAGGVGDSFEVNANGAMPTMDFVTLVAGDPLRGAFMMQHGAASTDNGPMLLTVQGSAGTKAKWIRHPAGDTAVKLALLRVHVESGLQKGGAVYHYKCFDTRTIGTSPIFARRLDLASYGGNEGFAYSDDLVPSVTAANQIVGGGQMQLISNTGTFTAAANNATLGIIGEVTVATNTTANSFAGMGESGAANAGGGRGYAIDGNWTLECDVLMFVTALSTGANEFAINMGYYREFVASQTTAANGMFFRYDRTNNTNWVAVCANGGVATTVDTGIAVQAGVRHRFSILREAGFPNVYFLIDGVIVATINTNVPVNTTVALQCIGFGSVGATVKNMMTVNRVRNYVFYPLGFAA